ncbi:MAG: arsenate reductase ArsC [Campylobacterales bacterium]
MKNVLILCTGNSCRSIMGEALINHHLGSKGVRAYSSGVAPSGAVNPDALRALSDAGISTEGLRSKKLDELQGIDFDLVVTVCDHAKETCPMFPGKAKVVHVGFEDPTGKEYSEYLKTRDLIAAELLPVVKRELYLV